MTKTLTVARAISAARGVLRSEGFKPEETDEFGAFEALSRLDLESPGSDFYFMATDNQYKTFLAEWRKWRRTA